MRAKKEGRHSSNIDPHTLEGQEQLLSELLQPKNRCPLDSELIQQVIQLDPDGWFLKFWNWMSTVKDTKEVVLLVNNSPTYRRYLASGALLQLQQIDFTKVSAEALMFYAGWGAQNFRILKKYCDWENFKYPQEAVPLEFMNEQIFKSGTSTPLEDYWSVIFSIYLWGYFVLPEASKRGKKNPVLEGFVAYHTDTDVKTREMARQLAPEGYRFPDKTKAWDKLEQAPEIKRVLNSFQRKYRDSFPLTSEVEDEQGGKILTESYVEAQEKLLNSVNEKKKDAYKAIIEGLNGYLAYSLLHMTKNDLIDEVKRERKRHKDYEITESQIDATRVTDEDEGDVPPFLDTFPGKDLKGLDDFPKQDDIDLKSLGLNIDKLTPKELWVIRDVLQGFEEGYSFDSKQGQSFRQRWGDNYQANKRAWQRAKARLKSK